MYPAYLIPPSPAMPNEPIRSLVVDLAAYRAQREMAPPPDGTRKPVWIGRMLQRDHNPEPPKDAA